MGQALKSAPNLLRLPAGERTDARNRSIERTYSASERAAPVSRQ